MVARSPVTGAGEALPSLHGQRHVSASAWRRARSPRPMGSLPCLTWLASRILSICWRSTRPAQRARTEFAVGRSRGRRKQRDQHPNDDRQRRASTPTQLRTHFELKTAGARKRLGGGGFGVVQVEVAGVVRRWLPSATGRPRVGVARYVYGAVSAHPDGCETSGIFWLGAGPPLDVLLDVGRVLGVGRRSRKDNQHD